MTARSTSRRSGVGRTPLRGSERPAQVLAHHRHAQRPGEMGERTDERRILLGAQLLQQAHRDEQQRRLVVVELQGWEQAALADPPATAGLLDVDAGVVAQGGDVALDGARVHLELLGELPRGQADLRLAEAREQLDDAELFLSLLVDAWHATSLACRPRTLRGCRAGSPSSSGPPGRCSGPVATKPSDTYNCCAATITGRSRAS